MRSLPMRRKVSLRILALCFLVFPAHSSWSEGLEHPLSGTVVEAQQVAANPEQYVGEKLVLFVDRVMSNGKYVHADDSRLGIQADRTELCPAISLRISEHLQEAWNKAGFDPVMEYTITVSGHLVDDSLPKIPCFYFEISEFQVNAEYGALDDPRLTPELKDKLPMQVLPLPLPLPVQDPRDIYLIPDQYIGRSLRFSASLWKRDLYRTTDGEVAFKEGELEIVLTDRQVNKLVDQINQTSDPVLRDSLVRLRVVAKIEASSVETKQIRLVAESIEFTRG